MRIFGYYIRVKNEGPPGPPVWAADKPRPGPVCTHCNRPYRWLHLCWECGWHEKG